MNEQCGELKEKEKETEQFIATISLFKQPAEVLWTSKPTPLNVSRDLVFRFMLGIDDIPTLQKGIKYLLKVTDGGSEDAKTVEAKIKFTSPTLFPNDGTYQSAGKTKIRNNTCGWQVGLVSNDKTTAQITQVTISFPKKRGS